MGRIVHYKVVTAINIAHFERDVEHLLDLGWDVHGVMNVTAYLNRVEFFQAMVKREKDCVHPFNEMDGMGHLVCVDCGFRRIPGL